ncbi:MAG: ABC transporter ATP-binding protein [Eubacteriales bacterium]|nr:ABC transporter ATP-binding protein [Eubacteriales bacterium]MDD4541804.1 ABC transporter ATP-binding protein [Eubacteriales bacterium]
MIKKITQQLAWLVRAYKPEYLVGLFAIILSNVAGVAPTRLAGYLADRIMLQDISFDIFLNYILLLVGLVVLNFFLNYVWNYYIFKASDVAPLLARQITARKIFSQSAPFFGRNTTGSLMGKATNDVNFIADMAGYGVMVMFDSSLYPATILAFMFSISWQLTLLTILPLPLLLFASKKIGAHLYEEFDDAQRAFDAMNDHVLENVSGVRIVRAYRLEDAQTERVDELAEEMYRKNMRVASWSALFMPASRLVSGMTYVIAIAFGAGLIRNGDITLGALISFVFFLGMMTWPMISMGEFINVSQQGSAAMERLQEVWDYQEDMEDAANTVPLKKIGDIEFRNFNFAWPDLEEDVLKDISFTIQAGQTVGIVGRIGSGKTTLLKQILRFYPQKADQPNALQTDLESLRLNAQPIQRYRRSDIRQKVGYVPQQTILFSKTIRENILLGDRSVPEIWPLNEEDLEKEKTLRKLSFRELNLEMKKRDETDGVYYWDKPESEKDETGDRSAYLECDQTMQEAIDTADFRKDLEILPQGLETMAGEKGIALSGGQKQRIAIARALISQPEVLILDDSLSAVDGTTEENILRELRRQRQGKTTIISAHRLSAVMEADQILVMEDGRIVARGTHNELMDQGGWYRVQYMKQQLERGNV